jgi:hypothetical protein
MMDREAQVRVKCAATKVYSTIRKAMRAAYNDLDTSRLDLDEKAAAWIVAMRWLTLATQKTIPRAEHPFGSPANRF